MKLVSIICLSLSLAVPTAAANGAKVCFGKEKNPDKLQLPDGKTQVRIICEGKAEDFGGESGDEAPVDCFDSKETTANSILKEACKNITVQIKYKMGNVMSGDNGREDSNRMYFKFADFGQGNFTKNVGIQEEFTKVSPENEPKEEYGPGKLSTHLYSATVNQCAVDGSNQFFYENEVETLQDLRKWDEGNGVSKRRNIRLFDFQMWNQRQDRFFNYSNPRQCADSGHSSSQGEERVISGRCKSGQ